MLVEGCEHVIRKLVGLAIGRKEEALGVNPSVCIGVGERAGIDNDELPASKIGVRRQLGGGFQSA